MANLLHSKSFAALLGALTISAGLPLTLGCDGDSADTAAAAHDPAAVRADPPGAGGAAPAGDPGGGPASAPLAVEAGFIDVPATSAIRGAARMFYDFHPADEDAAHKPLILLTNGGPGWATSAGLLSGGTAPHAIIAGDRQSHDPFVNPASWTSFANLLYVDARDAGLSYEFGNTKCAKGRDQASERESVSDDAGDFVRVLLDFVDAHPALTKSPIVLAGESYGATRVTVIASLLQHYAASRTTLPAPAWLRARMQAHVDLAFPELGGAEATPHEVARQFGHVLFIEGNVAGMTQVTAEAPLMRADPDLRRALRDPDVDAYDVRQTAAEGLAQDAYAAAAMRDPASFEKLVGVAPAAVARLGAADRVGAHRAFDASSADSAADAAVEEEALRADLGALGPNDAYFLESSVPCGAFMGDVQTLAAMADVLERTSFFMTRARYDAVVHPEVFATLFTDAGWGAVVREDVPAEAARPGVLELTPRGGTTISVRFPKYEAGHMVAQTAGSALHDDVRDWLASE